MSTTAEINLNVWNILKTAIIEVVPQIKQQLDVLTPNSRLHELGIASVDLYEVVGNLEDTLNISMPTEHLMRIRTVGELTMLIQGVLEDEQ